MWHTPARGPTAWQLHPPPVSNCNQIALTFRCGIRATDCSQDGSEEEMVQPLQPGTHGGRQSPPQSCPFPLAKVVRARDQWAGTVPLAALPGLFSRELGQPSLGWEGQVELQSNTHVPRPWPLSLFPIRAIEDVVRIKARSRKTIYFCIAGKTSSCKINHPVVQGTSLSPQICPKSQRHPLSPSHSWSLCMTRCELRGSSTGTAEEGTVRGAFHRVRNRSHLPPSGLDPRFVRDFVC